MSDRTMTDGKRERWGRWFAQATHAAGYKSQQDFADAAGFTRVQVQRWETGSVRPKEENIPLIAKALKSVATLEEVYQAAGYTVPVDRVTEFLREESKNLSDTVVFHIKEHPVAYHAGEVVQVPAESFNAILNQLNTLSQQIEKMSQKIEESQGKD